MKLAWVLAMQSLLLLLLLLGARISSGWVLYTYTAIIVNFEALDGSEKALVDFRDVHVVGEEHSLNGTVQFVEPLEPINFQMSIDFQHDPKRNNQWKPMIFSVPILDVCSAMRVFMGAYGKSALKYGENTNLPFTGKICPLPRGTYFVKNVLINTDTWPDIVPIGGLKINMRFYKQDKFVGGFRLTLDVKRMPF